MFAVVFAWGCGVGHARVVGNNVDGGIASVAVVMYMDVVVGVIVVADIAVVVVVVGVVVGGVVDSFGVVVDNYAD